MLMTLWMKYFAARSTHFLLDELNIVQRDIMTLQKDGDPPYFTRILRQSWLTDNTVLRGLDTIN